jgi:hypothetical protein
MHEKISQFRLVKSSAIFFKMQRQKMKHSANFIGYLGLLIGLKYETITKIANKKQQIPAEMIQKNPNISEFL